MIKNTFLEMKLFIDSLKCHYPANDWDSMKMRELAPIFNKLSRKIKTNTGYVRCNGGINHD